MSEVLELLVFSVSHFLLGPDQLAEGTPACGSSGPGYLSLVHAYVYLFNKISTHKILTSITVRLPRKNLTSILFYYLRTELKHQ